MKEDGKTPPAPLRTGYSRLVEKLRNRAGQGMVEYALVIAVVTVGAVLLILTLRGQISTVFDTVGPNMQVS